MDAGHLEISYRLAAGGFAELRGGVRRPHAGRLLAGRSVAQALALLPRLYALCGGAQLAVARAACALASGRAAAAAAPRDLPADAAAGAARSDDDDAECGRRLAAEALQEHLWRVMLDWPQALGVNADAAGFARWHRRLGAVGRAGAGSDAALVTELVTELGRFLAGPLREAAEPLLAALCRHEAPPPAWRPALLPARPLAEWAATLRTAPADFTRQPTLAGVACETGPLARHAELPSVRAALAAGRPLAARLQARLADLDAGLAVLAGQHPPPTVAAAAIAPGVAVAGVDTARGWLMHRVAVADGRIVDYAVIAPTEWNFHPQGGWLAEIAAQPAPDTAAAAAAIGRVVLSLDPCVAVRSTPLAADDRRETDDA